MRIEMRDDLPGCRKVYLSGELDHHASRTVIRAVGESLDDAPVPRLVLNLGGVTFSDSSGLAVALLFYRRMRSLGGRLEMEDLPGQMERLFRTAGLLQMLGIPIRKEAR